MNEKIEIAAAQTYPSHLLPVAECSHKREGFIVGAEWQEQQPLSQEKIDELLIEYINSVNPEVKMKLATYILIVLTGMSIDVNSAKTKLSTEMTYNNKRYNTQMIITHKEMKNQPLK